MKKKVIILAILLVIFTSFVYSASIPDECTEQEIRNTWDSMFEEISDNITIFTNDKVEEDQCTEYFAYKIQGTIAFILSGWYEKYNADPNQTMINTLRINTTQETINVLTNITNVTAGSQFMLQKLIEPPENNSQKRDGTFSIDNADGEFSSIFKISAGDFEEINKTNIIYYIFVENNTNTRGNNSVYTEEGGIITKEYNYAVAGYLKEITPIKTCVVNWSCGGWSECINKIKTRTCTDTGSCLPNKQENTTCTCEQMWQCSPWSQCMRGIQIRSCIDTKFCNNNTGKPTESQTCGIACTTNWQCTNWTPEECPKDKLQKRTCTDTTNCGTIEKKPDERKSCTYIPNVTWLIVLISLIVVIMIVSTIFIIKKRIKQKNIKSQIQKQIQQRQTAQRPLIRRLFPQQIPRIQENKIPPKVIARPVQRPIAKPIPRQGYRPISGRRPIQIRRPPPGRFIRRPPPRKPF